MGRKKREWEGGRVEGRRGLERILLPYSRAAYVKRFLHSLCLSIPFQHLVFTTSLSLVFLFFFLSSIFSHVSFTSPSFGPFFSFLEARMLERASGLRGR